MEELIKYFESLETRLAAAEQSVAAAEERLLAQNQQITALQAKIAELENRPAPEPQVIEKIVEVEKPVEKIVEKIVEVEKPVVVEEEPLTEEEPVEITETTEPTATPVAQEEPASRKAAIYGKAVDDIRLAISLGDRFLYQRELFGQNAERMQRTLTELNELSSFDEAMDYIARFNWDTESKTYQQFLVTLHRRFG